MHSSSQLYDVAANWSATAETKFLYTDNVFELSSARRLSPSEDPSQPAIASVSKPSDIVWEPSLDVRHTSNPMSLGQTEVSVKAHGFIFTDNPIFNHGNYRIQLKQALDPDTSLLFRYRYVPNLFLGPNSERRTGQRLAEEERVTSHVWGCNWSAGSLTFSPPLWSDDLDSANSMRCLPSGTRRSGRRGRSWSGWSIPGSRWRRPISTSEDWRRGDWMSNSRTMSPLASILHRWGRRSIWTPPGP